MGVLGAHLTNFPLAVDHERIDRLFTAKGKLDWSRVDAADRKPIERHLDVAGIFYETQYKWRYSAKCRVEPKLFGVERSAAYGLRRDSVDVLTAIPDRIKEDEVDLARVRAVTAIQIGNQRPSRAAPGR